MSDRLNGDTGDASLEAAGNAIGNLLSATTEDERKREAPRKPAPVEPEDAADPDDEEEAEQSSSEVESEADDEEPEPAKPEPRKLRVKVDGEELELPEDEVVKGYSRTEDYTRKTQKLADERKAFQSEAEGVRAERQRYATQLATLESVLKQATPAEPDWDTLRNGDPAVFAATYAAWDQHQKSVARVSEERVKAEQKVADDRSVAFQDHLKAESAKLVEAVPAWKDAAVATTEKKAIADYARSKGFSDEDLGAVTDHRLMLILRDAMHFQKAEKGKPAIREKIEKAKVLAPSTPPAKRDVSSVTKAKQALAKTGSLHDAGAAIALLLDQQ